jgi:sulfur carrier protein
MILLANGERQTLATESLSVADLLTLNKVENPAMVAVQLNGEFVDRAAYASTEIHENDEVDFLYFMGGGVQ